MATNMEHYKSLKQDVADRFTEIKELATEENVINEFNLDGESLRTPKLHGRWLGLLGEEAIKAKQIQNMLKKVTLERTRWYMGSQTDKYYAEYGQPHTRVAKTDLPLYLDADDYMGLMREIYEIQSQMVDFLEKTIKEISSRTFHIRSAIDWRKFESGS